MGGLQRCDVQDIGRFAFEDQDYSGVICGEDSYNYTMINGSFYQLMGIETTIPLGFATIHIPLYYSFRFTYYLTLLSCTFGILKFLDVGPTRILERDGWRNYVGFGIAFWSVLNSLHTKSLGLGVGGAIIHTVTDTFGYGRYAS